MKTIVNPLILCKYTGLTCPKQHLQQHEFDMPAIQEDHLKTPSWPSSTYTRCNTKSYATRANLNKILSTSSFPGFCRLKALLNKATRVHSKPAAAAVAAAAVQMCDLLQIFARSPHCKTADRRNNHYHPCPLRSSQKRLATIFNDSFCFWCSFETAVQSSSAASCNTPCIRHIGPLVFEHTGLTVARVCVSTTDTVFHWTGSAGGLPRFPRTARPGAG